MYPRYGLWDAAFLAFALKHLAEEQYAMMLYNQDASYVPPDAQDVALSPDALDESTSK
jgi:hypothetical protein